MKSAGLKLIALFLALVVWFVVSAPRRERPSERRFAAPISLVGLPREFVITTPVPETVSVRLRGRASDLRSLSSSIRLRAALPPCRSRDGDRSRTTK